KGVITEEAWNKNKNKFRFDYLKDNHFSEMKDSEIIYGRIGLLRDIDDYVGKYYSRAWVRKKILRQTEEEIKEIDNEIAQEPDVVESEIGENQPSQPQPEEKPETK